jgi:ELWxxDGT repeat protein
VKQIGPAGTQTYIHCLGFGASGLAYFIGSDTSHGQQLWRSDGTAGGTIILTAFTLQPYTTLTVLAFLPNGTVIFAANDNVYGNELWVSDGTSNGTHILVDLTPGPAGTPYFSGATFGSNFYFGFAGNPWITDGTAAGTKQIADIGSLAGSFSPSQFAAVSDGVLFIATTQGPGGEIWRTDGSSATRVSNPFPSTSGLVVDSLQELGARAIFRVTDPGTSRSQLWVTDETLAGTKQIAAGVSLAPANFMSTFVGHAVFTANSVPAGDQIWSTDGTDGGTQVLNAATAPGGSVTLGQTFVTQTNMIYSVANSAGNFETWVTDGTTGGTRNLGDFNTGSNLDSVSAVSGDSTATYILTTIGTGSVFGARATLSRLDGQSGNLAVTQLDVQSPQFLTALNGRLLFSNTAPASGQEPWISDGTAGGTQLLRDIAPSVRNGDSQPFLFAQFQGFAMMRATDGVHSAGLWRTDGTASGTQMLSGVYPDDELGVTIPSAIVNGRLVFAGNDGTNGGEPWVTDGTSAGTLLLKDISPGANSGIPASSYPGACGGFVTMGGYAYFGARNFPTTGDLWRTDGTPAGTTFIEDFRYSRFFSAASVCVLAQLNGYVFFTAEAPPDGAAGLWKTDGTAAGTTQVLDAASNPLAGPSSMVLLNGSLYFASSNGTARGIFRTDGTPAGTVAVVLPAIPASGLSGPYGPVVAGSYLFYSTCTSGSCTLFSTDGTSGQSTALSATSGMIPPVMSSFRGKVIYQGKSNDTGVEPWISDGTTQGTHLLLDIIPGNADSSPVGFVNFNGLLYFTISRPVSNGTVSEFWRTDGTASGTIPIGNVSATPIPYGIAVPSAVVGQHLLFTGSDATHGFELWSLDNSQPVLNPDAGTTPSDVALTIDVLANDVDSDGSLDPSSTQIVQQPTHGTASVVPGTGAIQYTPSSGYVGNDTLTYVASDLQQYVGAPATVTLTVTVPTGTGGGNGGTGGGGTGGGGSSGGGGTGSGGGGSGSGSGGTGSGPGDAGGGSGGGGGTIEPYVLLFLTLQLLQQGARRMKPTR